MVKTIDPPNKIKKRVYPPNKRVLKSTEKTKIKPKPIDYSKLTPRECNEKGGKWIYTHMSKDKKGQEHLVKGYCKKPSTKPRKERADKGKTRSEWKSEKLLLDMEKSKKKIIKLETRV